MTSLTDPVSLRCGLRLDRRVALAPLTNTQSNDDGTLSEAERRWLARRAEGGFPWVSTCATFVSDEGKAWRGQLGIARDAHVDGLSRLAQSLRDHGAIPVVQLHHAGKVAEQAPGPRLTTVDGEGCRGATPADLARVTADFVAAARRAERAGFLGVELHGANGYLFTQFLAPEDNPRTDDYGGPLEHRARLLRETLRAVRAAVRPDFAVGARISPVDTWGRRGLVLDDGVQLATWLAEDGADFIHLSLRDASGPPPFEADRGPVARAIRDALPRAVPLFAAGGVWTVDDAQRAFDVGVDVAVLGRAGIAHPDWPHAAPRDGFTPTRPPWSRDFLRRVDVSDAFIEYLCGFPGVVEGGKPARG